MTRSLLGGCGAVLAAALTLAASRCAAQEAPRLEDVVTSARRLIDAGNAAEAKKLLEKVVQDHPGTVHAHEAERLVSRIRTIDVFVDYSHEIVEAARAFPKFFRYAGWGVTSNHAYLLTHRGRLDEYELIIIWNHGSNVNYDELEFATLSEYVKDGGRLLLIGNPEEFARLNRGASVSAYPLWRLATRLGLRLKKQFEECPLGKGKVFHYRSDTAKNVLNIWSDVGEERREAQEFFERLLPYPKLEDATRNDVVPPEITFTAGRVTFRYAQPFAKPAEWVKKALPAAIKFYRDVFKEDPANEITLTGTSRSYLFPLPGPQFEVSLYMPREAVLYNLARDLYRGWMLPEGGYVGLPPWMELPWAGMMAVDFLKKAGVADVFASEERGRRNEFLRVDPEMNRIDIQVRPPQADAAWEGKCEFVFRHLVERYGTAMLGSFRQTAFLYRKAGKVDVPLSMAETIRLLSLAAGEDLFPYFQTLGVKVQPLPVDLEEPGRLRKLIGDKAPGPPEGP